MWARAVVALTRSSGTVRALVLGRLALVAARLEVRLLAGAKQRVHDGRTALLARARPFVPHAPYPSRVMLSKLN